MDCFCKIFLALFVSNFAVLVTSGKFSKIPFSPDNRIVGGIFSEEKQFPYFVAVVAYGGVWSETGLFRCGGSIIGPKWVLTAGHCYEPTTNKSEPVTYHIEAGSVKSGEPRQFDIVINDFFFVHPEYNLSTLENDVGLIKTKKWTFDDYVCPIEIALGSWTAESYVGEKAMAMGFGYTVDNGTSSKDLLWTKLTVISREECDPHYNDLPDTAICAEDKKNEPNQHSTCSGDSGGPLVIERHGKLVEIGIVSFGSADGCLEAPNGFANVALFYDWIMLTMAQN